MTGCDICRQEMDSCKHTHATLTTTHIYMEGVCVCARACVW